MRYDVAIIGGGIVGLSTGMALVRGDCDLKVLILEKEKELACHQSGRNSGVIHSGIYYQPGSLKANFAKEGNKSMVEFCQDHGIKHEVRGKVIVAVEERELPLLDNLYHRGLANGLEVAKLSRGQLKEIEPHVEGLAAIKVPSAGIVDFRQVTEKLAALTQEKGGDLCLGAKVTNIIGKSDGVVIESSAGDFQTKFLINCAGLHSDRLAKTAHVKTDVRIIPFRGEYYELKPEKRYLVKNLIYPVPNPKFPFLGVHFTRMIDGQVHAGPNAVISLKREGYKKSDFNLRDFIEIMTYAGFWRLAVRNLGEGFKEMVRSFSKAAFVHSLQRLVPEIERQDVVPSTAGVRAQALMRDGMIVQDFLVLRGQNTLHVCNAPSPAATASLEIGKFIANQFSETL